MTGVDDLLVAVDETFAVIADGRVRWADPHPTRQPLDEEYSRVTDPERYRIVGARADAWAQVLVARGLARIDRAVEWGDPPGTEVTSAVTVRPVVTDALPLVIARSRLGTCDDAGVTLGAGDPAVCIALVPDCGCDACDSGAQDLLDVVDRSVSAVVTGAYRSLSNGDRRIAVTADGMSTSNIGRREAEAVLADPRGWDVVEGAPWWT